MLYSTQNDNDKNVACSRCCSAEGEEDVDDDDDEGRRPTEWNAHTISLEIDKFIY